MESLIEDQRPRAKKPEARDNVSGRGDDDTSVIEPVGDDAIADS
jgi:hypothetical protein